MHATLNQFCPATFQAGAKTHKDRADIKKHSGKYMVLSGHGLTDAMTQAGYFCIHADMNVEIMTTLVMCLSYAMSLRINEVCARAAHAPSFEDYSFDGWLVWFYGGSRTSGGVRPAFTKICLLDPDLV